MKGLRAHLELHCSARTRRSCSGSTQKDSHPSYPRPIRPATFLLPTLVSSVRHINFRSRSEPSPSPITTSGDPSGSSDQRQKPFGVSPDNHIICFYMVVTTPNGRPCPALFTHCSVLLDFARYLPSDRLGNSTRLIPWENWGPSNTRWIKDGLNFEYECYIYGSRFVHKVDADDEGQRKIQVMDFNPYIVKQFQSDGRAGEPLTVLTEEVQVQCRVVDTTTILPKGPVFNENVHSSLPYREVTRSVPYGSFSLMIDEERILFLTVNISSFRFYLVRNSLFSPDQRSCLGSYNVNSGESLF